MSRGRLAVAGVTGALLVALVVVAMLDDAGATEVLIGLVAVLALGVLLESRLAQRRSARLVGSELRRLRQHVHKAQEDAHWSRRNAFAVRERMGAVAQRTQRIEAGVKELRRSAGYRYRDRIVEWRQVEALQNLYALLKPRQAVPALRGWAASPDLLLLIVGHVLEHRPRTVLECGSGSSTLWTAYALERLGAGRVISLEHDPHYAARTRELLARHGLSDYAEVRTAPLAPVKVGDEEWSWYDPAALAELPPVDLLVVDGPPATTGPLARYPAGPLLVDRLAPGGVIILDDAIREDERVIADRWSAELGLSVEHLRDLEKQALVLRRTAG